MFELMLDTANIEELKAGIEAYPISGVTSNPTILKAEGKIDVYEHLGIIKKLCGKRSLHVQVVSGTASEIVREARHITERLGHDVYIKIPVSTEGLPAIKQLASEGFNITATGIYSSFQGMLAALAGAKYIAVYYNRMENNCTDPKKVIEDIRTLIDQSGSGAKLLGASFKNLTEVTEAIVYGCHSITVQPSIITSGLGMASINYAVDNFAKDFWAIHGEGSTMLTVG